MKNPGQHHAEFRNYAGVIAASKNKTYQQASQPVKDAGELRRKVDDLMEQRRLNRELDLWD